MEVTKKQAIGKIASILSSFGLPVTPELIRQSSLDGSNDRIHELLILTIHALLVIDSNALWLLPSLKNKINLLIHSNLPISERLRYIRCRLNKLGFTLHMVTQNSSARQKLLCLAWLLLRVKAIPWYIKRIESLHKDKMRVPLYPSDFEGEWINRFLVDDANSAQEIDFGELSFEEMSKIITAFVRKIQLKGRFFQNHFKALAKLHDEIQRKTHLGESVLGSKMSAYELLLTFAEENEQELETHIQTLKFISDIYSSCSIFYQWMESIATSERLQGSGVVNTLDLDIPTLNRQLKQFNLDRFQELVRHVKEIHESLIVEAGNQSHADNDCAPSNSQWWPQVHLYEKKILDIEIQRMQKDSQNGSNASDAPFSLDPPYEHANVIFERNSRVPSGAVLEIKRLELVLDQVNDRLVELRQKHQRHLDGIIKSSKFKPL